MTDPKLDQADFEPVYSLKGVMHQKTFRRFMRSALDYAAGEHVESLPVDIREAYRLPALSDALEMIHFPQKSRRCEACKKTVRL